MGNFCHFLSISKEDAALRLCNPCKAVRDTLYRYLLLTASNACMVISVLRIHGAYTMLSASE